MEEYRKGVAKLAALLKPGGTLISLACERKMNTETGTCTIGSKQLPLLNITMEYIVSVFEQQGLSDITTKKCGVDNDTTLCYMIGTHIYFPQCRHQ